MKLPRLSGIGLLLFYGTPIGVDFAYFIDANKVCRGKINFLGCLEVFYVLSLFDGTPIFLLNFPFLMAPLVFLFCFSMATK